MWNDLCHGLSILSAAFAIACRSWGFWMSVGGVAGLAAVYVWWRRRMVLWAFFLALLFPLAVVGIVCYKLMDRDSFLCVAQPEAKSLAGVYAVESTPRERWFSRPAELNRFSRSVHPPSSFMKTEAARFPPSLAGSPGDGGYHKRRTGTTCPCWRKILSPPTGAPGP